MNRTLLIILSIAAVLVFIVSPEIYSQPRNIKGSFSGKIIDEETGLPLEAATVQIFNIIGDVLVDGGATDSKGDFKITEIPGGAYDIKISYIGYNTSVLKGIVINKKNTNVDLGTIKMKLSSEVTEEIEVTTEAPVMKMEFEKKVYELKQSMVTESGSALDVLKNIPSVNVDNEGNVSIRGSETIRVLIDGKPSALLGGDLSVVLEQIPANSIEKIEIINNPSAKYEAEGMAGILNIVIKKNTDLSGYNGNISINTGTNDKYSANIGLSYRKNNLGISANYSFRSFRMLGSGNGFRTNFFSDSLRTLDQATDFNNRWLSHFASLGFDYDINKKNNLNLSLNFNTRNRNRNELTKYKYFDINLIPSSLFDNLSNEDDDGYTAEGTLAYKLKFDKKNQELNTSFNYSFINAKAINDHYQQNYDLHGNNSANPLLTKDIADEKYRSATFQSDYLHPIGSESKLETGVKFNYRKIDISSEYQDFDYNTQNWIKDIIRSNNYIYYDYIGAVYASYAVNIKDFGLQAGLRTEYTKTDFTLSNTNEEYRNDYTDFFPTLNLTQKIGEENQFGFNYSRRINRPNSRFLNPFIDYSDPQNLRAGNPKLKPEYINAFELNYIRYFSTSSLTSSVFFRHSTDVINRFRRIDSTGVSVTTFENVAQQNSYGLEFIFQSAFTKWWNNMLSFSYYNVDLEGNDGIKDITNSSSSWNAKLMSNISIPKIFDFQIAYNYFGKRIMLQGSMEPWHMFDIAVKKDFLNRRISIMLRVSDLFKTGKFEFDINGTGFESTFSRIRDTRNVFLTFTYKFGTDMKEKKRSSKKREEDNMDNDIDF